MLSKFLDKSASFSEDVLSLQMQVLGVRNPDSHSSVILSQFLSFDQLNYFFGIFGEMRDFVGGLSMFYFLKFIENNLVLKAKIDHFFFLTYVFSKMVAWVEEI